MNHNLNILNLEVHGIDKHMVDVIRAIIAFKSTLVLQKLHLDLKKSLTSVPNIGKIIQDGKSTSK
jgi:hypothetical protein